MHDREGSRSTKEDDPRITRVGRYLRRWKLDEIPQLFNILKGEMGVFGPRPTLPDVVATLSVGQRSIVLSGKPGLIDSASLWDIDEAETLRGSEDPHKKFLEELYPEIVKRQIEYIKTKTLWGDIKLMFRVVWKIINK